jgi:hypothetical protein
VAELVALTLADEPAAWEALGFAVADARTVVGGVELELVGAGAGIVGWSLSGLASDDLDGLATVALDPGPAGAAGERRDEGAPAADGSHPNGAIALDHVVVATPAFARTRDALVAAGLDLRREADLRDTSMAFFRIGPTILELVARPDADTARFWGLVVVLPSLDDVHPGLAAHLGEPRDAVQPGRRIATLRESAGLTEAVAFMTPR